MGEKVGFISLRRIKPSTGTMTKGMQWKIFSQLQLWIISCEPFIYKLESCIFFNSMRPTVFSISWVHSPLFVSLYPAHVLDEDSHLGAKTLTQIPSLNMIQQFGGAGNRFPHTWSKQWIIQRETSFPSNIHTFFWKDQKPRVRHSFSCLRHWERMTQLVIYFIFLWLRK